MLNAQWLQTFTVLIETGHFTRAAERLGMTQPGVSQHLRKLEHQIGQPLISQQGKSFVTTPAGDAVYAMGIARRAEEKELLENVHSDDPDVGHVIVACSGSFALLLYPKLLSLMLEFLGLSFHLEATPQSHIPYGVLDGKFDFGITDSEPSNARLDASFLGREELCLVLPPDFSTAAVSFSSLDALGFVAHPDGFTYAEELFSLNFQNDFKGVENLHVRTFINQIGQIPLPVENGLGYTLLPKSGIDAYSNRAQLQLGKLPKSRHHDLWLVSRRGRILPKRIQKIAALIGSVAQTLDKQG
ncbi:LysR family transcriptional regulator [Ahrensia kielensis]|uniref:LysR family transcriptional regulator n=1 Tax=Ahrensia kielensis TaxID=76980 RepID=UPI000361765B|nr:LysR family transcriptional regulator [Ahrensia kielensis]